MNFSSWDLNFFKMQASVMNAKDAVVRRLKNSEREGTVGKNYI